jgi:uncharacterized protein involved in exopolysaccharide biosynthesis
MELHEYLHILRRRWVSVLVIALVVLLTATAVTFSMTKQYTATTRLFFAVSGTETVTDLAQGSTFAEKQMTSYAQVATSPLVLDPVISRPRPGDDRHQAGQIGVGNNPDGHRDSRRGGNEPRSRAGAEDRQRDRVAAVDGGGQADA